MRIDVLTLFPEVFTTYLASSIVGRARQSGIVSVDCVSIRDFAHDKHRTVDDRPFGGGPGMVMMCRPVFDALDQIDAQSDQRATRVLLTPQGQRLDQRIVQELSAESHLVLICGHYEGFDERIRTGINAREISIGDYVLSGGEPAAIVLIDAMVRLLPDALGDSRSAREDSFSNGLLEYPQYTRPQEFQGMKVPEVLLSGNHGKIEEWRQAQALARTRDRRPDLLNEVGSPST